MLICILYQVLWSGASAGIKSSSSPDTEDLIESAGRALTPYVLCGELISRRDLCTLFKVCKVSERAARRVPDGRTSGLAASG